MCYFVFVALISTSPSTPGAATSIQINQASVRNSAIISTLRNSVLVTSFLETLSSSSGQNEAGMSSDHVIPQTAFSGTPVGTVSNTFNISTQPAMNLMTQTVFDSSGLYTPYSLTRSQALVTPTSEENETPVLAVTSRVTNTSRPETSTVITPSTTSKVTIMKSRTSQDQGYRIKKLMEGI